MIQQHCDMPVPNPSCVPGRDYLVEDRSMKANDIDQSNPGVMHEHQGGKGVRNRWQRKRCQAEKEAEKVSGTVVLRRAEKVSGTVVLNS
jgi:hypothetical protein